MRYFFATILLFFVLSCRKDDLTKLKEKPEAKKLNDTIIIGSFEWSFTAVSIDAYQEMFDASSNENNYAIKTTKGGNVYTFKNGVETNSYYITNVISSPNQSIYKKIYANSYSSTNSITLTLDELGLLICNKYPLQYEKNYFYKN